MICPSLSPTLISLCSGADSTHEVCRQGLYCACDRFKLFTQVGLCICGPILPCLDRNSTAPGDCWASDKSATGASRGALAESRRPSLSTADQSTVISWHWISWAHSSVQVSVLLPVGTTATNSFKTSMPPAPVPFYHLDPARGSVTLSSPWWVALGAQDDMECRRAQAVIRGLQQQRSRRPVGASVVGMQLVHSGDLQDGCWVIGALFTPLMCSLPCVCMKLCMNCRCNRLVE